VRVADVIGMDVDVSYRRYSNVMTMNRNAGLGDEWSELGNTMNEG
jgi:hypothetical protein